MKCEDCKKKIEESKPKFYKPLVGYFLLIIILSFIAVLLYIAISGTEILSLGERLILITLMIISSFSFFFLPIGAKDLEKNYKLSYMKKYSVIKHFGKIAFLPYIIIVFHFGMIIVSNGDLFYPWLLLTANILFSVLWCVPLIIYIFEVKLNKVWKR